MRHVERLLINFGAVKVPATRHKVYLLMGERFTLHNGTKCVHFEDAQVRSKLRKLGFKVK